MARREALRVTAGVAASLGSCTDVESTAEANFGRIQPQARQGQQEFHALSAVLMHFFILIDAQGVGGHE